MIRSHVLALCVALMVGLGVGTTDAREGRQLTGWVTHVRDGDTIEVNGMPIRLNGLHAPELSEPGGRAARTWMIEHTSGQQVVCSLNGERTHDRWVGICENRDGDLATQLITAGLGATARATAAAATRRRSPRRSSPCRCRLTAGAGETGTDYGI